MVIGKKREGENDVINMIKHLKIVGKIVIEKYSERKKRVLKRIISRGGQFIRYTILLILPEHRVNMTKKCNNYRPQIIPFAPTCTYEHCLQWSQLPGI